MIDLTLNADFADRSDDRMYKVKKEKNKADFMMEGNMIPEVKAQNPIIKENSKHPINYWTVSKCKIGLLINFRVNTLEYKRFILTK